MQANIFRKNVKSSAFSEEQNSWIGIENIVHYGIAIFFLLFTIHKEQQKNATVTSSSKKVTGVKWVTIETRIKILECKSQQVFVVFNI